MKKLLYLVLFLLFAAQAEAATYWVSKASSPPGPHCNNSATDPGPFGSSLTIAQGIACMGPGDTLNIHAGTYTENITHTQLIGKSGSGTGNNYTSPTTIQAYSTDIVTIRGSIGISSPSTGVSIRYIIFKGLIFDCSTSGGCFSIGGGGNGGTVNHIKFDAIEGNNPVGGPGTGNILLTGEDGSTSDIWITNSKFRGNGLACGSNNLPAHGIYVQAPNTLIENTEISGVTGYGIHQYAGNTANNIYRNNYIHDNGHNGPCGSITAWGILLSTGGNNQVYGNTVTNNMNGITIVSNSNLIYNNTVYGNGVGYPDPPCCYEGIRIESYTNNTVKNNIVFGNALSGIADNGSGNTVNTNFFTDPLFTNAAANNFILQSGSTAINAGTVSIAPGTNIPACAGGITINCYNGTAPDMGALETGVPTAGGGPPTLVASAGSVTAGAAIKVTVDDDDVNERIEQTGDWVGIFAPGAAVPPGGAIDNIALFDWFYMNGSKSGPTTPISDAVIAFTAPSTPGSYEFRFYQNGSNFEADRLATAPFTVTVPGIVMKFNVSSLKIGPSVTWKIGTP